MSTENTFKEPTSSSMFKILGLSILGGALEVFDFVIFVFFYKIIQHVFFPADMPNWLGLIQTFAIFSAGYLARPLGGVLMARYADRLGRKKAFTISILMMSVTCFLISVLPTYAQIGYLAPLLLLCLRIVQGAAVGGEVPSAWVFVYEHAPKTHSCVSLGTLQAGLTLGYLLGAVTATILFNIFDQALLEAYAWRIPFLIGGVFGLVSVFMRRKLEETPVFLKMIEQVKTKEVFTIKQILCQHKRLIVPAMLMTCVLTSAVVSLIIINPTVMEQYYHFSTQDSMLLSSLAIMSLNVGCVLAGYIADKVGVWKSFYGYCVAMVIGFSLFYCVLHFSFFGQVMGAIVVGFSCGVVALVPSIMVTLFPAQYRVTAISLVYNLAYSVWAGVTPPLLIVLAIGSPLWVIGYVCLASMIGIILYHFTCHKQMINI